MREGRERERDSERESERDREREDNRARRREGGGRERGWPDLVDVDLLLLDLLDDVEDPAGVDGAVDVLGQLAVDLEQLLVAVVARLDGVGELLHLATHALDLRDEVGAAAGAVLV